MEMIDILFSFEGRINRAKWWLSILVVILLEIALCVLWYTVSSALVRALATLFCVILVIWITFAAGSKRLHDINRSGSWLIVFIATPVALAIVLVMLIGITSISGLVAAGTDGFPTWSHFKDLGVTVLVWSVIALALWIWWLVWFGCLPGTRGPNRFGSDPLEADGARR